MVRLGTQYAEADNLTLIKLSPKDSLEEYRKPIIYEYVTEKKEVND